MFAIAVWLGVCALGSILNSSSSQCASQERRFYDTSQFGRKNSSAFRPDVVQFLGTASTLVREVLGTAEFEAQARVQGIHADVKQKHFRHTVLRRS